MTRLFVALGDANDIRTRGGSPYNIGEAGRTIGYIDNAASLKLKSVSLRRIVWNVWSFMRRGERGGFQFSNQFAESVFRNSGVAPEYGSMLSQFPLFPPDSWLGGVECVYYIDATLTQLFASYDEQGNVGKKMREEAIARERLRYRSARAVICMSRWAARSVSEDYGIGTEKIHVVPGAANLDEGLVSGLDLDADRQLPEVLRLGFLGKDFERKNLQFLLEIAESVHNSGVPVEVVAAGFDPAMGPRHPLLRTLGYFDKKTQTRGLVRFMRSCHFGCLFSRAEAFGLSNMEFIRVGVPVLTWDVGGLADSVPSGLGHIFEANASAQTVASVVSAYHKDSDLYESLRHRVTADAHQATWTRTVETIARIELLPVSWTGSGVI